MDNKHEQFFELGGALECGNVTPQYPAATLEAMASELAREGNRPEGGASTLFRGGNLWDGGGI